MSSEHAAQTLTRLTQVLSETLDLSAVLTRVAEAAVDLVPDSAARIWTVEDDRLCLSAEAGMRTHERNDGAALEFGVGWAARVAATQELLVANADGGSAAAIPLLLRRRLVGVLVVATRGRHRFAAEELDLLGSFGVHAAIAIQNAMLFTRADRRRRAAEALAEVTRLMSQSLEVDGVGQRIVDSVRGLFDAVAAVLYRWDIELKDLTALSLSGDWGPVLDHVVFPAGTGLTALAVGQRRTVSTADVLTDAAVTLAPSVRERFAGSPARAQLAVPLIMRDRIIGALAIGRPPGGTFDAADVALAQAFGDQAAVALQNAGLFEEQLARFTPVAEEFRRLYPQAVVHAANSSATLRSRAAHFDMARCGIAIYGLDPFHEDPSPRGLEPALRLESYVADVKRVGAGESVGYGRSWHAQRDTEVAVLPIGYGDGYRRGLSNAGEVLIRGRRFPVVGTISMDNVTVEVGNAEVAVGDAATLIGTDGEERVSAEHLARLLGTINYEVTCGISARVPRVPLSS